MAVGGGGKVINKMLLGYPDDYMDSNTGDYQTSKIGGLPDWCSQPKTGSSKLTCPLCSSNLVLVTQIYAPLDNSVYHRCLYVFCCVQPACWNQSKSWKCVRSQIKEISTESTTTTTTTQLFSATDWCEEADDWGEDSNDNNGNVSVCLTPPSVSLSTPSPDSPPPQGAVGGATKRLRNLNLGDANANSGGQDNVDHEEGVLGVGEGVSAQVEKDDELTGFVSVDLPQVDVSHVPGLFHGSNNASIPSEGLIITPIYIWVGEEQLDLKPTQHELNLSKQYQNEVFDDEKGGGGGDSYEKTLPRHGDEYSYKFISTLQRNPGQVLRYASSSNESPLLFQSLDKNEISKCKHCGGKLRFELQLLPTLVNFIQVEGIRDNVVEFGTVIVYTCTESCWSDTHHYTEELVIVQQEIM